MNTGTKESRRGGDGHPGPGVIAFLSLSICRLGKCTLKERGVFLSQVINLGCLCSLANTGETIAVRGNQGLWHTCCALKFAA